MPKIGLMVLAVVLIVFIVFSIISAVKKGVAWYMGFSSVGVFGLSNVLNTDVFGEWGLRLAELTGGLTFVPIALAIAFLLGWLKSVVKIVLVLGVAVTIGFLAVKGFDGSFINLLNK